MKALTENINVKKVIFRGKHYENYEISDAIDFLAKKLSANYKSGSPFVLLSAYNHIKTLIAFYAILKSGKIAVIINPEIKDIELSEIIEETDPAAFILMDTNNVEFHFENEIIFRTISPGFNIISDLDDVVLLMYTNAEDGKAKAAMITESNLVSSIKTYSLFENFSKKNVVCSLAPFHHLLGLAYGLLMPCYVGATVLISNLNLVRIHGFLTEISNACVNYFISVPSFYFLISKIPGIDEILKNSNDFISGGIKLSPQIFETFLNKTGKIIREGYGLTETSPGVTLSHRDTISNPESIGQVFPNCEINIVDESGQICQNNKVGEIHIRGKNVFKGYYNEPVVTKKYIVNNWLATGDLGKKDEKGNLYFYGLKKNMYNVAGNNVYPNELERLLKINKHVNSVKVFKENSIFQGDIVGAEIELDQHTNGNITHFKKWCAENITKYKIPSIWKFL